LLKSIIGGEKSIIDSSLARVEVDLTNELEGIPGPKHACYSPNGPGSKLDQISDKLDQAKGKLDGIELTVQVSFNVITSVCLGSCINCCSCQNLVKPALYVAELHDHCVIDSDRILSWHSNKAHYFLL